MVAGAKLHEGELAGVGGSGAIEDHSGFCLVQKNVHTTRNPLECTGWRFWDRQWREAALVAGKPRSRGSGPVLGQVLLLGVTKKHG